MKNTDTTQLRLLAVDLDGTLRCCLKGNSTPNSASDVAPLPEALDFFNSEKVKSEYDSVVAITNQKGLTECNPDTGKPYKKYWQAYQVEWQTQKIFKAIDYTYLCPDEGGCLIQLTNEYPRWSKVTRSRRSCAFKGFRKPNPGMLLYAIYFYLFNYSDKESQKSQVARLNPDWFRKPKLAYLVDWLSLYQYYLSVTFVGDYKTDKDCLENTKNWFFNHKESHQFGDRMTSTKAEDVLNFEYFDHVEFFSKYGE